MKRLIIFVAVCFTLQDVRDESCRALCVHDGYSGGKYSGKNCHCYDDKGKYEDFVNRSMSLGPQPIAPFIPESQVKPKSNLDDYSL